MELEIRILRMYIKESTRLRILKDEHSLESDFDECIKIQNKIKEVEYLIYHFRQLLNIK